MGGRIAVRRSGRRSFLNHMNVTDNRNKGYRNP